MDYYVVKAEQEWGRLETTWGAQEFAMTKALLEPHLPAAGRVLDIGGGPGRYAGWLAEQGYRVTLADAVPELLDIARERVAGIDEIVRADARDLSRWADDSFDVVLCLGPMYHLTAATDRRRAIAEVVRVLRPGGLAAFAFITWYSHVRRVVSRPEEREEFDDPEFLRRLAEDGVFQRAQPGTFGGYAVRPTEIEAEFDGSGLDPIAVATVQSFGGELAPRFAELRESHPAAYDEIFRLMVEHATDPSLRGGSTHLLYLARRPLPADGAS